MKPAHTLLRFGRNDLPTDKYCAVRFQTWLHGNLHVSKRPDVLTLCSLRPGFCS